MKNRFLNIYIKDKDCIDLDDDGIVTSDEIFTIFSISPKTFYKRNKKDTYEKLINKIKGDIEFSYIVDPKMDLSQDKSILEEMENSNPNDFFNSFEAVSFIDADINFIKTVVLNNISFFQGRKFILSNTYGMSLEDYLNVKEDIKTITTIVPGWNPQILIKICGNTLPVDVDDYFASFSIIQDIVATVKSLNVSVLEQIMFVYDIVKKRVFNKEDNEKDAYDSRDLTSSLLGDKIVCAGFNIIFGTILTALGIDSIPIKLKDKKDDEGHVRTCIFVDDPKYRVKGHYFFDVTWDSNVDEKSPNSYKFFMKTLNEMILADKEASLYFEDDLYLYPNFIYETLKKLKDNFSYSEFIAMGGKTRFNHYLKNMGEPTIEIEFENNNKKELISAYKKIYDSFNKRIDPLDFANLLYNVKRLDYYLDPMNTPFSEDDFAQAILGNTFSRFNRNEKELNLLSNILGVPISEIEKRDKQELLRNTITPKLRHDIASIKLTRTLRETLLKK